jgi:type II secretory pathway component GspD/PulD (secretin)
MITTTVTASISKRGADVSSTLGNPPPTSEKVLTTQVRSRSGEAVVLSGLRQNEDNANVVRMPLVSKIPFLGWLFKSQESDIENTQMVIYLVPHIDLASDEYTVEGLKTASLYTRFAEPFLDKK